MKVEIQSIHFDADQKLLQFITRKLKKVTTFSEGIHFAYVYLRLEKDSEKNNKAVEIKVTVSGVPIFAKEYSTTFESATYLAIEKVKSQVKKRKQKVQEKI